MSSLTRQKPSNLDKNLGKGRPEVNIATFALLFSEIVQYCQNRVYTVPELQSNEDKVAGGFVALSTELAELGQHVGSHLLDVMFLREKGFKREIKLLQMLIFIKSNVWKTLFGKEADKLEHANDDERTYYIIEKESLVNKFISVPKDKGNLNCAAFTAGILESILNGANFPAKVTVHWHKGTTFLIKFDESVIARDKHIDGR